jgi:DnaJ-class molecular chaperone
MSSQTSTLDSSRTRYCLETCATCHGSGLACEACDSKGWVLVQMPSQRCVRCEGSGIERNRPASVSPVCVSCFGSGWENVVRAVR